MALGVLNMEQLDLNALRLLIQIIECGSLGQAQKTLGVAKSSLSRKLNQFEKDLNLKLVERQSSGLTLTDMGQRLVKQAAPLIKELNQVDDLLAGFNDEPKGLLRISVPLEFGIHFISPILADFVAKFPEIEVDIDISPKRRDLKKDNIDVALRFGLQEPDQDYVAKALCVMSMDLYCAPAFYEAYHVQMQSMKLKQLQQLPCIGSRENETWPFVTAQGERICQTVSSRFHAPSTAFKRDAAIAGIGIAYLPNFICKAALAAGELMKLEIDVKPVTTSFYAIYQQSHYQNPKLHKFLEHLHAALAKRTV